MGIEVTRLQGSDRYATSLAIARRFVQASGGSIDAAVVVSGTSWQHAAVASGLAGSLDAPLLLTPRDKLPNATADFLAEAGVSRVVIVGGPDAVSNAVLASLKRVGSAERLWGSDPVATSVAVAQRMGTPGVMPGLGRTVVLAHSDALANVHVLAPFSARGRHPVLLTPPDALDERVKSYLASSGTRHVLTVGNLDAVSNAALNELRPIGVSYTRYLSSPLSLALSVESILDGQYSDSRSGRCFDRSTVGIASALVPFDAFSAGPLLSKLCAPLLVIEPDQSLHRVARLIRSKTNALVVFGGEAAVSSRALSFVDDAAGLRSVFDNAAQQREKIAASLTRMIDAGSYGVDDDNVLHGPAGFQISLDDCPSDWSDTAGITDGEIRIGLVLPQTGPYEAYGLIEKGVQNYLNWVNKNDPVAGRQITLATKDDAYAPSRTINQVDTLIEAENAFSILTLGSPPTLAVYDRINDACVPHPFAATDHPALGVPANHPWTTGMQMSQSTEARLWGEWIEQRFRNELPVKVAGLVRDDELGRTYQSAFETWAAAHPDVVTEFLAVRHEPQTLSLDAEMASIAAFDPVVYISMTAGNECWRAIPPAHREGVVAGVESNVGALVASSACRSSMLYPRLSVWAFHDWWVVGTALKFTDDPAHAGDPFVKFVRDNFGLYGAATGHQMYDAGYWYAYPYVEALRIAARLPGDLTRSNFILAVRSLDISHPLVVDGVKFRVNGNDDAHFIEGARFHQFDAEARALEPVGPAIDIDGQTPNCSWNRTTSRCR